MVSPAEIYIIWNYNWFKIRDIHLINLYSDDPVPTCMVPFNSGTVTMLN